MTLNVTPASTFDEGFLFFFLYAFGQKITFLFSLPVVYQVQQEKLFAFFVPLLIQWAKKLLITTWTRWFAVFAVVGAPSKKQVEDVNCKSLCQLQTFSSVFFYKETQGRKEIVIRHILFFCSLLVSLLLSVTTAVTNLFCFDWCFPGSLSQLKSSAKPALA